MDQPKNSMLLDLQRGRCSWIAGYGAVAALCKEISARRVCEIGVAYGYHAESLLGALELDLYLGVDPYEPNYDPEDSFSRDVEDLFRGKEGAPFDMLYQAVAQRLTNSGNGIATLLRLKSCEAASLIKDATFDLVYIDGDHRPHAVYDDICNWVPKVRKGGIICGDDVRWPGTEKMLIQVSREFGYEIKLLEWNGQHEKWFFSKTD